MEYNKLLDELKTCIYNVLHIYMLEEDYLINIAQNILPRDIMYITYMVLTKNNRKIDIKKFDQIKFNLTLSEYVLILGKSIYEED